MGLGRPKPFLPLGGKPILYYSAKVFEKSTAVRDILFVVRKQDVKACEALVRRFHFKKTRGVITGGRSRQESVYNGLRKLSPGTDVVLIHDAARPFIDAKIVEKTAKLARKTGAAIAAAPVKDTIKIKSHRLLTLNRRRLWHAQTPQAFRYKLLMEAYREAFADRLLGTDDAQLVEKFGANVSIVPGTDRNLKITTPVDLKLAQILIKGGAL